MKKITLTLLLSIAIGLLTWGQVPQLINLQSAYRDQQGEVVANQDLDIMITLRAGTAEGESVYTETHTVTTDAQGIVNIALGSKDELQEFSSIPWDQPIFIQIDVKLSGESSFTTIDVSQLLSVPYALFTNTNILGDALQGQTLLHNGEGWVATTQVSINTNQVEVLPQEGRNAEDPIFLVRNSAGQVVFAVYESGVEIKVAQSEETVKGTKGGFAVGGLSDQTKLSPTYLSLEPDQVQFNILQPTDAKSTKGGFAVGGLSDQTKQLTNNFMVLSPDSARFLLSPSATKSTKGGFAVGGLSDQTKGFVNWLRLNRDTTYVQTPALTFTEDIQIDSNIVVTGEVITSPVKDIDGNTYKTVNIGKQVWMAENLKTTKYRNGTPIATDVADTSLATVGVYDFNLVDGINTEAELVAAYGRLYNWKAINNSQGLCPIGWAVPTNDDWIELVDFLGGDSIAGGPMKSRRTDGTSLHPRWDLPNTSANNISGFTGLPGGYLWPDVVASIYSNLGQNGYWWSANEASSFQGFVISLAFDTVAIFGDPADKRYLSSVRCIKTDAKLPVITTAEAADIQAASAIVSGTITDNGGSPILKAGVVWDTLSNPSIERNLDHFNSSPELSTFDALIEGLDPLKTYYAKAYATNKAGTTYGNEVVFTTTDFNRCGTITDADGNVYQTIQIGDQCWMAENLKTTKYFDGREIISDPFAYNIGLYFPYEPGNEIYGNVYNGIAAMSDSLCPIGWYMPSEEDFNVLIDFLGGGNMAGEKLKAKGDTLTGDGLWIWPNIATNTSGFSALPGGIASAGDGINFSDIGFMGMWWSNTEFVGTKNSDRTKNPETKSGNDIMSLQLYNSDPSASISPNWPDNLINVRCIWGKGLPRLAKTVVNDILINIASVSATIISDGGDPAFPITDRGFVVSTSPEPTVETNQFIFSEPVAGTGEFSNTFTGLTKNTLYYVRAFATNGNGTVYGNQTQFKTYNQTVSDIDGNVYYTTFIGDQHWMAEDLRTTKYNSGISIQNIIDPGVWSSTFEGAYVDYNQVAKSSKAQAGKLYNWYAVSDTLCPVGWRVPFAIEWDILEEYLGDNAGGKLKALDTAYWQDPNTGATNESGFTAFGTGYRTFDGFYYDQKFNGYWWTATIDIQSPGNAMYRGLTNWDSYVLTGTQVVNAGLSIRCIQDTGLPIVSTTSLDFVTETEAYLAGNVDYEGSSAVTEVGFVWDINPSPDLTTNAGSVVAVPEGNYFGADLLGLTANTKYYARAYATNGSGTGYSKDFVFTTASQGLDFEGFESGTFADVWVQSEPGWVIDNTNAYEGVYSARSSTINDGQSAKISMTFYTISGMGSFYFKTSTESGYDFLTFYVNGQQINQWSGELDWQIFEFSVSEGYNTFTWEYSKDAACCIGGQDAVWIDSIVFPPRNYAAVLIGSQRWMVHNLNTTEYLTGEAIYFEPHGSVPPPGNYYSENPTPGTNAQNYGYAYSMGVANDTRGVCPTGWLVPSREDWITLFDFLGGQFVAGGKMKTMEMDPPIGDGNWSEPNTDATNESGFSAVPAGYRGSSGMFYGLNTGEVAAAYFWSSTILADTVNWAVNLTYDSGEAFAITTFKPNFGVEDALSIRCLEDDGRPIFNTSAPTSITTTEAFSGGEFIDFGDFPILEKGIVWSSVSQLPSLVDYEGFTQEGSIAQNFASNLTALVSGIDYYVRAYVTTTQGTYYGNQIIRFTTLLAK